MFSAPSDGTNIYDTVSADPGQAQPAQLQDVDIRDTAAPSYNDQVPHYNLRSRNVPHHDESAADTYAYLSQMRRETTGESETTTPKTWSERLYSSIESRVPRYVQRQLRDPKKSRAGVLMRFAFDSVCESTKAKTKRLRETRYAKKLGDLRKRATTKVAVSDGDDAAHFEYEWVTPIRRFFQKNWRGILSSIPVIILVMLVLRYFIPSDPYADRFPLSNKEIAKLKIDDVYYFTDHDVIRALPHNRTQIRTSPGLVLLLSRHSEFPLISDLGAQLVPVAGSDLVRVPQPASLRRLPTVLHQHIPSVDVPLDAITSLKSPLVGKKKFGEVIRAIEEHSLKQELQCMSATNLRLHLRLWRMEELEDTDDIVGVKRTYRVYANPQGPPEPLVSRGSVLLEETVVGTAEKVAVRRWKAVNIPVMRLFKTNTGGVEWRRVDLKLTGSNAICMQILYNTFHGYSQTHSNLLAKKKKPFLAEFGVNADLFTTLQSTAPDPLKKKP